MTVTIIAICFTPLIIIATTPTIRFWLDRRTRVQHDELRTRRIEALAKMDESGRKALLALPDFVDPDDPQDVEAWKKAKVETLNAGKSA